MTTVVTATKRSITFVEANIFQAGTLSDTHTHTITHTHTHLQSPNDLECMSLDRGRKLEGTHAGTGRTC